MIKEMLMNGAQKKKKTDLKKREKFMNFTNGELSFARILVTFGNSLKVDLKQTCCFSYIESITAVHVIPRRAKL